MLIDTHCHLNDAKAFPDPRAEIGAALEKGVDRLIVVGTAPEDWERAVRMAEAHPEVWAIVGWHPNYTADYDSSTLKRLRELLAHPRVLALGEIGLDYHWAYAERTVQFEALRDGLDLAAETGKPVVFHAREAYSDLLDVLENRPPHPYLFHCFAGTKEEGSRAVKLGAKFGVDGPITYPKAEELRETIRSLPFESLVVETDAPYMSPVPFRGKPNRPVNVREVAEGLAKALGKSFDEVAMQTTATARAFFRF
ncbi:TatD family deoxyribonuclease [bacterium]|nr:MAG: TatD family deoxyribonuclease [bacterium]